MPKKMCPKEVIKAMKNGIEGNRLTKINLIWLEACGCSGNIISLLNANDPDITYFLNEMVNITYNNSIMAEEGRGAVERFLETLDTEFILVVEGAVTTKDNGIYNIIAEYNGKLLSGAEAISLAAGKAKYVIAVGTCASYGGPTAAKPNPSSSTSVPDFLGTEVIRVPGCPANPHWVISTIAHLILYGLPELDTEKRPVFLYGDTIHTYCSRRSFFDQNIFATKLGDKGCYFQLGCRGPMTKSDCPLRKWNDRVNWPVEDNTPCIGCTEKEFPGETEPFIKL